MDSWVSCAPTALVKDRTRASGSVVRGANHCTTEARLGRYRQVLNLPISLLYEYASEVHYNNWESKLWSITNLNRVEIEMSNEAKPPL